MKKHIILLLVWIALSCTPDDSVAPVAYRYAGIRTLGLSTSVNEDSGTPIDIPVYFGGELKNDASFTVSYTVTGGTYGTDYTIVGGSGASGNVTIAAGDAGTAKGTISILPKADLVTESNVVLTLTLGEASNGYSIGYPLASSFKVTIADDDCDYVEADFVPKTAKTREVYTSSTYPSSGTSCLGTASRYCTEFVKTGTNTFELDNLWDSGWVVPVNVDPANLTVSIPSTIKNSFGSTWTITGEGTISTCAKTMKITIHLTDTVYGYDDYTYIQEYTF